ncbi:MAG: recombinase family protein [Pseudomonadales bacterium]|nr:recombinase family protein [Pseudomonadales bacterium]
MKYGYARVSTGDQTLDLQTDALLAVGCERLYTDHGASGRDTPPWVRRLLGDLQDGDNVVVWRLDRLGRWITSGVVQMFSIIPMKNGRP